MTNGTETENWNGRALLTDLYQLTMAYGYWKSGRADREAVFHLFFRKAPFQSGFTIAAGLATAIDFLSSYHFTEADLDFLSLMTGNDGNPLSVTQAAAQQQYYDYESGSGTCGG